MRFYCFLLLKGTFNLKFITSGEHKIDLLIYNEYFNAIETNKNILCITKSNVNFATLVNSQRKKYLYFI